MNLDRSKEMLKKYMAQASGNLSTLIDVHGIHRSVLSEAMNMFTHSLINLPLPEEAACKKGCAYCCHLRVGVSIAEVVVLFNELKTQVNPKELAFMKQNVIQTAGKGNIMNEAWWRGTRTACPFLDTEMQNQCLIYGLRPFSCRAYHSTDREACCKGYENGQEMQIPCFPLYRSFTDMYSSVLIQVMAQKGLHSYQVGFVRALEVLFEDETATDRWFQGEDVFMAAKLS